MTQLFQQTPMRFHSDLEFKLAPRGSQQGKWLKFNTEKEARYKIWNSKFSFDFFWKIGFDQEINLQV